MNRTRWIIVGSLVAVVSDAVAVVGAEEETASTSAPPGTGTATLR